MVLTYLKLLMTAFFWGGTFIAGRLIANSVGTYSAAFFRFLIASVFLLLITWKTEGRIPKIRRDQIFPVVLLGMTGVFAYNIFFFKGMQLVEAGRAAVIIANNPVFIAIFSAMLFKEKLNRIQISGILLSVAGAMTVISRGRLLDIVAGGFGWGEFLIFCCVLSWVTFSLIGRMILTNLSPLTSVTYAATIGTAALALPAIFEGVYYQIPAYTIVDWLSLFFLGFFGTVLGFVWYYQGIRIIGATRAGLFINFVPVSAIILAFFILDEPITASLFVGTVLVVGGVYLTNKTRVDRKDDEIQP